MRRLHDRFFKQAKVQGYLARSAYKLLEIHQKHRLISPGDSCLDLGCSPGAWLQVACQALGPQSKGGLVLGVDLKDTPVPKVHCDHRVKTMQADVRDLDAGNLAEHCKGFNVVMSDMCHATTGSAAVDTALSLELATCAATLAVGNLQQGTGHAGLLLPEGHMVIKVLQGSGTRELTQDLKQHFTKVVHMFPEASRQESREVYVVALNRTY